MNRFESEKPVSPAFASGMLWLCLVACMVLSPVYGASADCHLIKFQTSAEIEYEGSEEMSQIDDVSALRDRWAHVVSEPRIGHKLTYVQPEDKPPPV